jgi:hypothetical protein
VVTFMAAVLPDVPAVGTPHGTVQFSIDNGPGVAVNIGDTFTPAALLQEGQHTITAKYCNGITSSACAAPGGDGLFYGSGDSLTFTVKPRAITATADYVTKVYGDADPALTYAVTSGTLVAGDSFSGSLAREESENAGTHAISQGTLALSPNYTLTFNAAKLKITPRPITVTANDTSKTEGDADPALTYTITSGSLAFSDAFAGALTREAGEAAGTYAITQGTLQLTPNYTLNFVGGTFTIAPPPVCDGSCGGDGASGSDNV